MTKEREKNTIKTTKMYTFWPQSTTSLTGDREQKGKYVSQWGREWGGEPT